ncbi:MAG: putative rane protein [Herminiimonas sp.]|nr:putative rane protein [Herminiimonas sp.]
MSVLVAIGERIRLADPRHHAILKGMAWVALFVLAGKIMGAAKEMVVAYRYGTGADLDAYLFVFSLIGLPVGIWSSAVTSVLVPLAARLRQQGERELRRFRSELLGLILLVAVGLWSVWGAIFYLALVSGWTGLPPATAQIALRAVPALLLLLPLGILISLHSAWMLAAGRHVNTLLECVPALALMVVVLAFPDGGIAPLIWGTVAGAVCHLISLVIPLSRRGEIQAPVFHRESAQWTWFWKGFGILVAGQALMSLTAIVDQFFAARLPTGAIATLGYANRVLALILGLAATAVARATLPVFSEAQTRGGDALHRVVMHWVRLQFMLGIAAAIVGYLLAPWGMKVLFERGAFTAANTEAAAEVLRYGIAQVPFYFSGLVFASYAASQGLYRLLFWCGVIGIVSKTAVNAALVPSMGINGIAAGWVVVYGLNWTFFWLTLGRRKSTDSLSPA